jgi:hypothetical protein
MVHVLHSHSQLLATHQAHMLASLRHRLEIAREANNLQLVEQLEREKQQIAPDAPQYRISESLSAWLSSIRQSIANVIAAEPNLEVRQFGNGSDRWWYAFDPRTGDCVYADSEAELRVWIKENYQGR